MNAEGEIIMDTLNAKLKDSTDRLVAQGSSFLSTTREAGEGFVSRARSAGEHFWSETFEAGGELIDRTGEARKELTLSVQEEAGLWLEYFRTDGPKLKGLPKLKAPSLNGERPKVPSVRAVEKRIWTGIGGALQDLEARVQQRIQVLDQNAALPSGTASKKNGAAKKIARGKGHDADAELTSAAPISGYEKLTAKEIVGKVQKLDRKKVEALLAYEQETKNRATVVNAILARLEA
jgi:hypothetical protein